MQQTAFCKRRISTRRGPLFTNHIIEAINDERCPLIEG